MLLSAADHIDGILLVLVENLQTNLEDVARRKQGNRDDAVLLGEEVSSTRVISSSRRTAVSIRLERRSICSYGVGEINAIELEG